MGQAPSESNQVTVQKIVGIEAVFPEQKGVVPSVHYLCNQIQIEVAGPMSPESEQVEVGGLAYFGKEWVEGLMSQIVVEQGGTIFSSEQRKKIEIATLFVNGLLVLRDAEPKERYSDNCHPLGVLAEAYGLIKTASGKRVSIDKILIQFGTETNPTLVETGGDPVHWAWERFKEANNKGDENALYLKLCELLNIVEGRDFVIPIQQMMSWIFM